MLFNLKLFNRVFYALTLLFAIILVGTVGFVLVEDYTIVEGFYMTIITISTVGFSEVRPLSPQGRLFTATLIITSFGIFAYAITSITTYLIGGEYKSYFKEYKLLKTVKGLSGHTIVCGHGRVGTQAIAELEAHKQQFVVIEEKDEMIEVFREKKNYNHVHGNATVDENLEKAGIGKARALITTLPSDADNLFVVLSAKALNPNLIIISRASKKTSIKKLRTAGATNVIMPDSLGGSHMASLVVTPDVLEFLDHISIQGRSEMTLESISFNELPQEYKFKTIDDLDAKYSTGCNIIGYKNPEGEYIINPSGDLELVPGSSLIVLGNPDQLKSLNRIFGIS